jgi:hypothetical protein
MLYATNQSSMLGAGGAGVHAARTQSGARAGEDGGCVGRGVEFVCCVLLTKPLRSILLTKLTKPLCGMLLTMLLCSVLGV